MSAARDEILARIRAVERAPSPPPARDYRRAGTLAPEQRVALFCERARDYSADVRRVDDAAAAIAASCREHNVCRLGIPPDFPWRPVGIELVEDYGLTPSELDALDGVATGSTVAVAETGTIILTTSPAEGRRALTLVPDLHLCVVRDDQIVELVPEALDRLPRDRSPITLVSGPSATSDIELDRVEGVHGPRRLVILVVCDRH